MKEQRTEMTKTCISWHHCNEFKEEKFSYKKQSGLADVTGLLPENGITILSTKQTQKAHNH